MKKYLAIVNSELITPARMGIQGADLRHPIETFLKVFRHFASDSLYRNSIYLMLSTAVMAFFGFFFWIIVARLYTPEQVGIATTLISVMGLIASFSILGLNVGLIRFLPTSKNKNELINSSFAVTTLTAVVISLIFLLGINFFSPMLVFVRDNVFFAVIFIISVIALTNNTIIDSLFTAYRSAKYTLIKNTIFSISKLILPLLLVSLAGFGIFLATGIAYVLAYTVSISILIKFFDYRILLKRDFNQLKKISLYSFGNYITGFLYTLPIMALPVFITNKLGAEQTGYFYISMLIASLVYVIPQGVTSSLFAEGSNEIKNMKNHTIKAIKMISLILFPTIILFVIFGNILLSAFGSNYSSEAFGLLQYLTFSSIFISVGNIAGIVLKIQNKIKELVVIGFINTLILFLLVYLLIGGGLYGIGFAWLLGQIIAMFVYLFFVFKK